MLSSVRGAQSKYHVLQACSLRRWPMNPADDYIRRNSSGVEDKIAYLPIEYIGGLEAKDSPRMSCVTRLILIAIDQSEGCIIWCGLDDWKTTWIAYDLGEVIIDDGR